MMEMIKGKYKKESKNKSRRHNDNKEDWENDKNKSNNKWEEEEKRSNYISCNKGRNGMLFLTKH